MKAARAGRCYSLPWAVVLLLAGCGPARTHPPLPPPYAGVQPPAGTLSDPQARAAGQALFRQNCAVCHGAEGNGTGPYALRLTPQPADFTDPQATWRTPAYLFWRISEGKNAEPFYSQGSAMPAWKYHLTEAEIWQIIAYIKTLAR